MFEAKTRIIESRGLSPAAREATAIGSQLRFEAMRQGRYQLPLLPNWSADLSSKYGLLLDFDCQQLLWTAGGSALLLKALYKEYLEVRCRDALWQLVQSQDVRDKIAEECGLACGSAGQCAQSIAGLIGCDGPCAGTVIVQQLFTYEPATATKGSQWTTKPLSTVPAHLKCLAMTPSKLWTPNGIVGLRVCHDGAFHQLWTSSATTSSAVPGAKAPFDALGLSLKGKAAGAGGTAADDAWWRLRKALALALLRDCAWTKAIKPSLPNRDIVGPLSVAELQAALAGPNSTQGCGNAWAMKELADGDAALISELTGLCAP